MISARALKSTREGACATLAGPWRRAPATRCLPGRILNFSISVFQIFSIYLCVHGPVEVTCARLPGPTLLRLYYWKQWKQPRTSRRHLLALGADPKTIHMATRSRKGYWRMSQNEIVRFALNNCWLEEQGVPDLRAIWIKLHYGPDARV